MTFIDPPVSTLLAGGAGTAAGLYAYGSSNHKVMCGSVAWAVGSGLALASPLCKDALIKDSATIKDAIRGYNSQVKCRVIFPDNAEYGLTVDSAAGALAFSAS